MDKKESDVSDKKTTTKDKMSPVVDQNPSTNYQRLHQSLLVANKKLLYKMNVLQRKSSFWKRQHTQVVKTIWGWTTTTPPNKAPLWTMIPDTKTVKEKRKRNSAVGFTFPSEIPQSPKKLTNVTDPTGSTPDRPNSLDTPKKPRTSKKNSSSTRRSKRLNLTGKTSI